MIQDLTKDPKYEPVKQACGYTLAVLFFCLYVFSALISCITFTQKTILSNSVSLIASVLLSVFYFLALHYPDYLGGNPRIQKLFPLLLAQALNLVLEFFDSNDNFMGRISLTRALILSVVHLSLSFFAYKAYIREDNKPSCFFCCKPWVYKLKSNDYYACSGNLQQPYYVNGYPGTGISYGKPSFSQNPEIYHQPYSPYSTHAPQNYPQMYPSQECQDGHPQQSRMVNGASFAQSPQIQPFASAPMSPNTIVMPTGAPPNYHETMKPPSNYGYYGNSK